MTKRGPHPAVIPLSLFLGALLVRVLVLLWVSRSTGVEWRNLALMYDGHFYILISRSFPSLYAGINETFPLFANSAVFTGWFPVYPFLIYLADFLFRDPRVSALAVSMLAGGLSVVLFHRLARRVTARPVFAAAIFCFFTPTWLLASTLALVESVYLCLFLAAILCFIAGNRMAAIALAGAVIITQKSGGLILPVFALALLWRHGPRGLVKFAPYLLALVPLILMQGYLYFLFGDPFVNARVQHETGFPNVLGLPFSAMAAGLGKADQIFQGDFWLRKALLALSCLFYTGVFALSWKGRAKPDRVLMLWLAMVLLFNLSLAGPWAYYAFPRFMTLAVPPAILLLVRRLPPSLAPRTLAPLALAVPVLFWIIAQDVQSAVDLMMRTWTPRYFELLLRHIL